MSTPSPSCHVLSQKVWPLPPERDVIYEWSPSPFLFFFKTLEDGSEIAQELMKKLKIDPNDLISGAYMDLFEGKFIF